MVVRADHLPVRFPDSLILNCPSSWVLLGLGLGEFQVCFSHSHQGGNTVRTSNLSLLQSHKWALMLGEKKVVPCKIWMINIGMFGLTKYHEIPLYLDSHRTQWNSPTQQPYVLFLLYCSFWSREKSLGRVAGKDRHNNVHCVSGVLSNVFDGLSSI